MGSLLRNDFMVITVRRLCIVDILWVYVMVSYYVNIITTTISMVILLHISNHLNNGTLHYL